MSGKNSDMRKVKANKFISADYLPDKKISAGLREIVLAVENRELLKDVIFVFSDGDEWTWEQLRDYAIKIDIGEIVPDYLEKKSDNKV